MCVGSKPRVIQREGFTWETEDMKCLVVQWSVSCVWYIKWSRRQKSLGTIDKSMVFRTVTNESLSKTWEKTMSKSHLWLQLKINDYWQGHKINFNNIPCIWSNISLSAVSQRFIQLLSLDWEAQFDWGKPMEVCSFLIVLVSSWELIVQI